ncbi:MAG: 3-deoxy-8-phosphooctulonate synthase [Saprospiraceae bacterium]|nr:3-deoxy-8-phosphooctulonate synthase [Saprospiraceae bacterium]
MNKVLEQIRTGNHQQFFLIAGPCAVESKDLCFEVAETVQRLTTEREIPYVFKASFKKANRSKDDSFTGMGDDYGLDILASVRDHFNLPVTTDIHETYQAEMAARCIDVLQIPAFLCRQTDLLKAAGATGKVVSIKKGQFLSPEGMKWAVKKVNNTGNDNVWLIERGTTFGYQDLVVDFRGIPVMKELGVPVVMDCTHALQQPNQSSGVTGGNPAMIGTIAKAAIAVGADGLFIETHPNPAVALSDGANMLKLDRLEELLDQLVKVRNAVI